ncbi:MAG TPA: hypothetical protein QF572_07205, partial [Vicinamibacterales bacterium]|nr:hypothetical protein [Vicinamibacterales bacterium]
DLDGHPAEVVDALPTRECPWASSPRRSPSGGAPGTSPRRCWRFAAAIDFVRANGQTVAVSVLVLAAGVGYAVWSRRQRARSSPDA